MEALDTWRRFAARKRSGFPVPGTYVPGYHIPPLRGFRFVDNDERAGLIVLHKSKFRVSREATLCDSLGRQSQVR